MNDSLSPIEKVKKLQLTFRKEIGLLRDNKKEIFLQFKKELENRKISEIKNNISSNSNN